MAGTGNTPGGGNGPKLPFGRWRKRKKSTREKRIRYFRSRSAS